MVQRWYWDLYRGVLEMYIDTIIYFKVSKILIQNAIFLLNIFKSNLSSKKFIIYELKL